jgi:hypothetical protein
MELPMPSSQLLSPDTVAISYSSDCSPSAVSGVGLPLVAQESGGGCAPYEARKGRPAKHASAAARKAAYRAEKARVDFTDKPEIIAKLRETAVQLDCSVNELLQSMVRFAECNRNWKQVGLYGARRDGVLQ